MKKFDEFIAEDGAVASAPSTTAGVQNYQSPIGSKKPTAKKPEIDGKANKIKPITRTT